MTILLKQNSEEIRKRIEDAGIKVCHCALYKDADWLDYHPGNTDSVHGLGYPYEGMTKEETQSLFLHEERYIVLCKNVEEFIEEIKNSKHG